MIHLKWKKLSRIMLLCAIGVVDIIFFVVAAVVVASVRWSCYYESNSCCDEMMVVLLHHCLLNFRHTRNNKKKFFVVAVVVGNFLCFALFYTLILNKIKSKSIGWSGLICWGRSGREWKQNNANKKLSAKYYFSYCYFFNLVKMLS